MSTPYQVMFGDKNLNADIEDEHRFYKKRNISQIPQSQWLYSIFRESMNTKINAISMLIVIFTVFSIIYYEIVIETASNQRATLTELTELKDQIGKSNDETEILKIKQKNDDLYDGIKFDAELLYHAFCIIQILSYIDMTFLLQSVVTFIYTKRLNRYFQFPTLHHITDLVLFACSCIFIKWF